MRMPCLIPCFLQLPRFQSILPCGTCSTAESCYHHTVKSCIAFRLQRCSMHECACLQHLPSTISTSGQLYHTDSSFVMQAAVSAAAAAVLRNHEASPQDLEAAAAASPDQNAQQVLSDCVRALCQWRDDVARHEDEGTACWPSPFGSLWRLPYGATPTFSCCLL